MFFSIAVFSAVEYNRPECVRVMLDVLGPKEPNKHVFLVNNNRENVSALELARFRGQ